MWYLWCSELTCQLDRADRCIAPTAGRVSHNEDSFRFIVICNFLFYRNRPLREKIHKSILPYIFYFPKANIVFVIFRYYVHYFCCLIKFYRLITFFAFLISYSSSYLSHEICCCANSLEIMQK